MKNGTLSLSKSSSKVPSSLSSSSRGGRSKEILTFLVGLTIGFAMNTMLCSMSFASSNNSNDNDPMMIITQSSSIQPPETKKTKTTRRTATGSTIESTSSLNANNNKNHHHNRFSGNPISHDTQQQNKYGINLNNLTVPWDYQYFNITPRAYPYWPIGMKLPCYERPWSKTEEERAKKDRTKGFLFLKPIKVGSSTAMGVNLRIAENEALRQNKNYTRCTATHGHGKGYYYRNRIPDQSFLWSLIRNPTSRAISEFFHFKVSREKVEPTTENFIKMVNSNQVLAKNYYFSAHELTPDPFEYNRPGRYNHTSTIERFLNGYDFIGITERFDESLVVMQQLLRLPLGDILYLNAKQGGNYDDGGLHNTCYYIVPSFVTPGMKEYFNSQKWQTFIQRDMVFYNAANASLDKTIDETIGRTAFDKALAKFKSAQQIVNTECSTEDQTKFPCTNDGVKLSEHLTDCYHKDSGCGKTCMNNVIANPKYHDIFF